VAGCHESENVVKQGFWRTEARKALPPLQINKSGVIFAVPNEIQFLNFAELHFQRFCYY
jgi:hypothetical protein